MSMDRLREDYEGIPLEAADCHADPVEQFRTWFECALSEEIPMANAMALATCDKEGPHCRIVLLKGFDERGFVFFTDYASHKGEQLSQVPKAALTFWWHALHRQVRVEGSCHKVPAKESDAYFATRPRESNLSAMASRQSRPLDSRQTLEAAIAHLDETLTEALTRPQGWGGFRVVPERVEFWQGRENRAHDRIVYQRGSDGWALSRLYP